MRLLHPVPKTSAQFLSLKSIIIIMRVIKVCIIIIMRVIKVCIIIIMRVIKVCIIIIMCLTNSTYHPYFANISVVLHLYRF